MRQFSWLLALALLPMFLVSSPAAGYEPPRGAVFNTPRPWGSDAEKYKIVRTVEKAIRETRPTKADKNPVILISTYLLDRKASVDALVGACRRGVAVRVILDEDIKNKNSRRLITMLNGDNVPDKNGDGKPDRKAKRGKCNRPLKKDRVAASKIAPGEEGYTRLDDGSEVMSRKAARESVQVPTEDSVTWGKDGSYVKRCQGSCRGKGGNMHSKFYAFTHTGKAKNVVMVSSSNLNAGGALNGWNDLFVMKSRPRGFAGYKRIHRAMTEDTKAGDGKVELKDGPFISRFFPMKNAGKAKDPTLADLKRIRCTSKLGKTQVNVSMFYWKGTRGNYLATKLLDLARAGCNVSIAYGAPSVQIAERLRNAAKANLINLYDTRWDFNDDGYNEVRTHAKYVLVKGTVGKDRTAWRVWTGSQNWVAGSLSRGDETTLNIALKPAYQAYMRNWNKIRSHSRKLPYN